MNQQPIESRVQGDGSVIDLHSIFRTLQGEGPFSGERAVFVRLAGCNLQCPGCDTEYTKNRTKVMPEEVVAMVRAAGDGVARDLVVITGGEPLRQSVGRLVDLLILSGHRVQIESNGSMPPDERLFDLLLNQHSMLTLVVSPKTRNINMRCFEYAHAFKYVLSADSVDSTDGLPIFALDHSRGNGVARPRLGAPVYLSPMDDGSDQLNRENRLAVAESCLKHGYRAGVQLHKLLELE